jgi:hypothetical protein
MKTNSQIIKPEIRPVPTVPNIPATNPEISPNPEKNNPYHPIPEITPDRKPEITPVRNFLNLGAGKQPCLLFAGRIK